MINNFSQMQNTLYPNPGPVAQAILKNASGVMDAYGTIVPVNGSAGFVIGATFKLSTGGTGTSLYVNEGSVTSSRFVAAVADVPTAYGTAAGRGPSPLIWDDCPVLEYELNPELGDHMFDDLQNGIVVASTQNTAAAAALGTTGNWAAFTAANPTITTLTTDRKGIVRLLATDDNVDAVIAYPKSAQTAGIFEFAVGKKFWMEARIMQTAVNNNEGTIFIGFAEEGLLATGTLLLINEAGMADKDYVGFQRIYADGDYLDTVHNNTDTAHIVVGSDAVLTVAGAYQKIGIYCDGINVYFYNNGVLLADSTTLAAASFPVGDPMAFYMGVMGGVDAADVDINVDWVRIAQEY